MQILKLVFIGLLLSPLSLWSQKTFFNVYSSGNFDIGEGICQLSDSSYLVTGSSGGFKTTSPQAFVMKVSKKGEHIWTVDKGGSEAEAGRRVFYMNDTIYLFGRTNSFGNSYDYYFLKLDSLGNTLNEKVIGTPDYEWLQDVIFLPKDSTFVLYGSWQENNGFTKKRQLIKIDRAGNVLWEKEYPIHLDARLTSMHAINDSVFGITGNEFNINSNHFDGLFYTYSYQGNRIDSVLFPGQVGKDYCFNDFVKHLAGYLLVGDSELSENGVDYYDNRQVSYNPTTHIIKEAIPGFGDYYKTKIEYLVKKKSTFDHFYVVERAKLGSFNTYSDNNWDEQISLYLGQDTLFWFQTLSNVSSFGNDITNQAIQTLDGGMISVGYNEFYANGTQNVFLVKIGGNNESPPYYAHPVEEPLLKVISTNTPTSFTVYPNPVSEKLFIDTEEDITLAIYDSKGSLKMETSGTSIDVSVLTPGMYILKIVSNSSSSTFKFVKD